MKNTNDSIIKNYIKQVLKLIPSTYRSRLQTELHSSITECFHDTPELTVSMLQEHFGTPKEFATEYLSGMDGEELQSTLARSKKQKRILSIALICLLVLLIPVSIWIFTEGDRHVGHFYTDKINYLDTY
ncbi:MAG: hypothetical protein IKT67_07705 [Lachnospiraceae bacterium]|nr:hypothetical protein [Lachnospiraceae bacterium]